MPAWIVGISHALRRLGWLPVVFLGVAALANPPRPAAPTGPDHPLRDKLRSPRDTVQTLYFAIDLYDFFPALVHEAVACLDLGDSMPPESASASLLAVQLESVLNSLDIPLAAVPDRQDGEPVTLFDSDDIKVSLSRGADGLWRFDRATVERIPDMRRTVVSRQKNLMTERASLREGYSDARTTMKRFWIDVITGDFNAASRALDLSALSTQQRREKGAAMAQMLAFVLQRRGYTYLQLFPSNPNAPPFTWHADDTGRIVLERVHFPDGKDAWLFNQSTVAQLKRMYDAGQSAVPDFRFARLNKVVPPLPADGTAVVVGVKPDSVPAKLGSPRALLQGFFRAMDASENSDAAVGDAIDCLDLGGIPDKDRRSLGATLAGKVEAVLRALRLDLSAVPDNWDSAPVVLGESRGLKVELQRQRDGAWRFNESTVGRIPELFEKLPAKERADRERVGQFDSARDAAVTFITALNQGDYEMAARCLDLSDFFPSSQAEVGPILAYKLKYILDRTGRIYIQEVPDDPDGPRYALYRGEVGRVVLAKRTSEPHKGQWLFTTDTVKKIEPMYRAVHGRDLDASVRDIIGKGARDPSAWDMPGIWVRNRMPEWARLKAGPFEAYQWVGLGVALISCGVIASVVLRQLNWLVAFFLRHGGSSLSQKYVGKKLRPLTWLAGVLLFFQLLSALDLPIAWLDSVLALKKFLLAGLVAWFGFGIIDLVMSVYTNSEFMKPHRSLSDMIVPVTMRLTKGVTIIVVLTYIVYEIGQGDLLGRFLTGLGVAGLAASLAAQDALKSFFGTLLLIGERSFKIGDRISVDNKIEGVVETVGFRSSVLRTPTGSQVSIPNSTIASASINNFGNNPQRSAAA